MTTPVTLGPSLLFCPADRPERFEKAARAADGVILDLEDAVAPDKKAAARDAVIASTLDPATTIVRINPIGSADFALDLAALAASNFSIVMVAKCEDPESLDALSEYSVLALCETAKGIVAAERIAAHPSVIGLMWGAEDLVASLGGTSSRRADGEYRDVARVARARVLLAAGAAGKLAIDAVHLDIPDTAGLEREARDAVASGFAATACIHPTQAAGIRAAYAPNREEVARARAILQAASTNPGVFAFEGQMIDEPVLRHARSLVARESAASAHAPASGSAAAPSD
ncbi:HpcH/HpaI aldolase/citrate lyase family protein [Humidisolicoccus flavus]|uniref:HpcH/HpaI aldolase/citrate lyase family protein n=1 Tax=Humidisolicoccus flavus TaxID=3111414 RepID=UPI0032534A4A